MKIRFKITVSLLVSALICLTARAEGGSSTVYSPFSKFGIGNLNTPGTSYNKSMGGVGVAARDNRFINILNPAAVTARDSLAFMADFGVNESNSFFKQNDISSVTNTFNIGDFVLSFPIWRSSAFMIGITPYSGVGYDFLIPGTDPSTIGYTGAMTDAYSGTGGLHQVFLAAGVTFWKKLSIGAQLNYYFGNIEKYSLRSFTSSSIRSIYHGNQMYLNAFSGKFGLQYEQPLATNKLTFGATVSLPARLRGTNQKITYASQSSVVTGVDTVDVFKNGCNVKIPTELALGVSYRHKDKWFIEFDYSYSDWTKSGMTETSGFYNYGFSSSKSNSFNLGFEIVPNRNDIRYYFKRCTYHAGLYHKKEYYSYGTGADSRQMTATGFTLGMTFPIFRWYNGLSIALDFGQRGSLNGNFGQMAPIRERYFKISVSLNVFDIWFIKPKYE